MAIVRIPAAGREYRVGKIICLARNYVDHIRELGNETPERAVLFIKPATSVIGDGEAVVIPKYSAECHYEIELAVLIGRPGKNIAETDALAHVAGYGVGIDMTLRDVQNELKKKGLPWELAKGFDTSCPLSVFVPAEQVPDPQVLRLTLRVNGEVRQDATTALMLRPVAAIIREASEAFTLEAGDVILTGTPAGVGPVRPGDRMTAEIEGVGRVEIPVR